jgi:AraC family transcriptional regulator
MTEHNWERINKVLLYIDDHLEDDLSLDTLSNVGCYSPFHLHRLFKGVTGETLNNYITRKRIEKIAFSLMHRKQLTIAELSTSFGFSSNASLTRTFTKFYGVSPSRFRKLLPEEYSKIGKADSKNGQNEPVFHQYICNINNCIKHMEMNAKTEIKELPAITYGFVTAIGVDALDHAFDKIVKWSRKQGLTERPNFRLLRVFHDSFKVTGPNKVRMSIATPVEEGMSVSGDIGRSTTQKGKYIVARFEIEPKDFGLSWEAAFVWMNEKGYQKAPGDPYEVLNNNYNDHPEKKCIVDFCIPIL